MRSLLSLASILIISPFALTFLSAAAKNYEAGPSMSDEDIAQIDENTTKDDIEDKNGPPSYRCFHTNGHNICYFHQKKQKGEPEQQRHVEINFNKDGKVTEVSVYELQ